MKRYKAEEIVSKLRQADVLLSQGQNVADVIRQIGVTNVTDQPPLSGPGQVDLGTPGELE